MDTATQSAPRSIPPPQRPLGALDLAVLWGDLGIGLLVLVTGALLVPALGFPAALAATVAGSVVGVGMLAAVAAAGSERGVATMALLRPVLGVRGSWVPTVLNVAQLVGWTAVELWAMSFVADLVSRQVFGFSARGLWLVVAAAACTGLAWWGPVGVTRVWMERFGVWVVGGISLAVTALIAVSGDLGALGAPGTGGFPTLGPALDLVIAMPVSWLPLVADYSRYAAQPRRAAWGTFWGYLIANVWLYALGAALVLTAGADPSPAGIAAGILSLAGGSIAGIAFLMGLLAGETDEAFANIYSGAVSLTNIFERLPVRVGVVLIGAVGAWLAAGFDMLAYETFLFLIGSVFVPLFGVMLAQHHRARSITVAPRPALALAAWLAGFAVYHWINPSPLQAWMELLDSIWGPPLAARLPWLAASVPAFVVSFVLTWAVSGDISSPHPKTLKR